MLVFFVVGSSGKYHTISNAIIEAYSGNILNLSIEGYMPRCLCLVFSALYQCIHANFPRLAFSNFPKYVGELFKRISITFLYSDALNDFLLLPLLSDMASRGIYIFWADIRLEYRATSWLLPQREC